MPLLTISSKVINTVANNVLNILFRIISESITMPKMLPINPTTAAIKKIKTIRFITLFKVSLSNILLFLIFSKKCTKPNTCRELTTNNVSLE